MTRMDEEASGRLSAPETKKGRLQRALLTLYAQHQADGMLPTSGRFLWYELSQAGIVDKTFSRGHPGVRRGVDQDVSDALTSLRELGLIPGAAIVDETRTLYMYIGAQTFAAGARAMLEGCASTPGGGVRRSSCVSRARWRGCSARPSASTAP